MKLGKIITVVGPMCSGKSLYLTMLIEREMRRNRRVIVTKPSVDTRNEKLFSRFGNTTHPLTSTLESLMNLSSMELFYNAKLLVIDEINLESRFKEVRELVDRLSTNGIDVVIAGLDTDFRGEPFEITANFMTIADEVVKLTSVCNVCGEDATRTQRLIDGEPANYDDPLIVVDDGNTYDGKEVEYQARCRFCHSVKGAGNGVSKE